MRMRRNGRFLGSFADGSIGESRQTMLEVPGVTFGVAKSAATYCCDSPGTKVLESMCS